MTKDRTYRLMISGGGTGGHVFPAIAIAHAFSERHPGTEILFVGAEGRIEMTKVPEAGYKIVGLWISGLQRKLTAANLLFPVKVIASLLKARKLVKSFKPDAVVGTGGYASGPVMMAAAQFRIPSLIQEQNSYAGLTNKRLAARAQRICVAYPGMEKFFPKDKIVMTGNPVRKDIAELESKRSSALKTYGFDANIKTLLILGGSLGARTINESVLAGIDKLIKAQVQVIWQTGKSYFQSVKDQVGDKDLQRIRISDFVTQMDQAYASADVVISRAGALSISELCLAGRPSILVPSPNVVDDHQTKNAKALEDQGAAILISDGQAREMLVSKALELLNDEPRRKQLSQSISKMAKPNAAIDIAQEIEKLIK
jgi:UDP-N-acetylglucosamine--N-acetylmuramyl-(pentapeptide) pyrophosphoryl-undecaprenol N-acetylglucosamine transferase